VYTLRSVSLKQFPKLDNPYDRLAFVFEQLPDEKQSYRKLVEKKSGGVYSCAFGGVGLKIGKLEENDMIEKRFLKSLNVFGKNPESVESIFDEFGFSKKDKEKEFLCPEPKCNERWQLPSLIVHMNDDHHYKRRFIGKIIRKFKNMDEPPDLTFADHLFLLKESFRTLIKFP